MQIVIVGTIFLQVYQNYYGGGGGGGLGKFIFLNLGQQYMVK